MANDEEGAWLWPLLRCPRCMSALHPLSAAAEYTPHGNASVRLQPASSRVSVSGCRRQSQTLAVLRCTGCDHEYPVCGVGAGQTPIPRLKRDDTLATLAHDVVVGSQDPDSMPADRRRYVRRATRRELFLGRLLSRIPDPYAILAKRPVPEAHEPMPGESAAFDRFVRVLPAGGTVLDLACGRGAWTWRLATRGLRVIGLDSSAPSLTVAARAVQPDSAVAFVEADMMEMPFAAASLDGVWCSDAFAYVRADRRAIFFRQVHRVLRPDGALYLGAETKPLGKVLRRYLLWRIAFGKPVVFGEYIYRLPPALGGGWEYHAMTSARTLGALCRAHGFRVLSLRHEGARWLLLARKIGR